MNCKNFILFALMTLLFSDVLWAQTETVSGKTPEVVTNKSEEFTGKKKGNPAREVLELLKSREKVSERKIKKMARGFADARNVDEAEYWYSRSINKKSKAVDLFRYAEILQSKGKCEDAARWFKLYKKKAKISEDAYGVFMENCSFDFDVAENKNIKVANLVDINTPSLDYSAIPFQQGVVFTSTRNEKGNEKENHTDLFFAIKKSTKESGALSFDKAYVLDNIIRDSKHDGVAAFNKFGTQMFITRTSDRGGNLKIYASNKLAGSWSEPQELAFNSNRYSCCHPSISDDGERLYFASDMPGGFGGMDIYVCTLEDGEWKNPVNLGPIVNSEKADVFPFISADEKLYFTSNGHQGIGGMDIFKVEKSIFKDEYCWNERTHLGTPVNSKDDDFAFYTDKLNESGFFSSNRTGGKGGDDIYAWEVRKEDTPETVVAKKEIKKSLKRKVAEKTIEKQNTVAEKPKTQEFNTERNLDIGNDLYITLKPDVADNRLIAIANKPVEKALLEKNAGASASVGETSGDVKVEKKKNVVKRANSYNSSVANTVEFALLRNIYHQFGEHALNSISKNTLDQMVFVLKENPAVNIFIESHTDSKGSPDFNQKLSLKRAESVRDYFVKKGIHISRMTAIGHGESQLKNHCKDGVECSEIEHLENRRTEMRINNN